MVVKVYTKTVCPACDLVKNYLDNKRIKFEDRNIETDLNYRDEVIEMGFNGVPITVPPTGEPVVGFDPNKLDKLKGEDV